MSYCLNFISHSKEAMVTFPTPYIEHWKLLSDFQSRTRGSGPVLRASSIKSLAIQPTCVGSFNDSNQEIMKKLYQAIRSFRTLETLYIVPTDTENLRDISPVCGMLEQEHKKYGQAGIIGALLFSTISWVQMTRHGCCILSQNV